MGNKLTREDLRLVSDFSYNAYPYKIEAAFEDPHDGAEIFNKKQAFEAAVAMAGIQDYKIFAGSFNAALHLRNEDDFDMVSVAMRPDAQIEQSFAFAPEGFDFRKLKNRRNRLMTQIKKTSLHGQIYLDVDREENAIVVIAENKRAYLGFRQLMSNAPAFQSF